MKNPIGNPGRPTKAPSDSALSQLGMFTWVVPDAREILKQCGAPASWGDDELGLILTFMRSPYVLDALSDLKRRDRRDKRSKLLLQYKTANALKWAKMFADAPQTMMYALPRIEALVDWFSGKTRSPKKRDRNVCQEVVFYYAMCNDVGRFTGSTFSKRFWSEKADAIALECSKRLNLPVTVRVIEDARAVIRKRL